MTYTRKDILKMMRERILILDGATGTYLQQLRLTEEDFRGTLFGNHPLPLKGCNDVLCLTKPDAIKQMHQDYINAGADIIETNSFNCNRFSLADYGLENKVYEIAKAAAEVAKSARESTSSLRERAGGEALIIAGSMGPTNKTASMSADVNNPAAREVTFQELVETYTDCVRGLLDGGADVILVETIFDTLNAKAAIKAVSNVGEERGIDIPIMASGTLADASGRTLSGQTVEAYVASLTHANLISIGLNCAFGARQLKPWLKRLAEVAPCPVSVHPNAGLPNVMGGYDETPETFAEAARDFMGEGLINIYGGCCGTTPAHIKAIAEAAKEFKPRPLTCPTGILSPKGEEKVTNIPRCTLSGLEPLLLDENTGFVNIGERTNVAGSAKFKKLIQAENYEEALSIARAQVDAGAQVIDVCMDDGLIDGVKAMTTFLNLIASEPEIARVPIMIDSSKWEILEAGLQCVQGKSIINSISLKEGEEKFIKKAKYIHSMGATTVVMLFDEKGQADTYERKVEVARRAYKLLREIGFPGEDIIFDPNVLAVATGMPEHDDYGRAFVEACRTIHKEMPEVHMSGGISNLSFSFRGNNPVRQAMHSVFLYHAIQAGLDMSIVNPAMLTIYDDIEEPMRTYVEDVVLNKPLTRLAGTLSPEGEGKDTLTPSERLIEFATKLKEELDAKKEANGGKAPEKKVEMPTTLKERIAFAMLKGITDSIDADTLEAYEKAGTPLGVIDEYLMPAMEQVGKLFGEGKMFLPQVVKSARVMKKAVAVLEPYMQRPLPDPPHKGAGIDSISNDKETPLIEEKSCSENSVTTPLPPREGQGGGSPTVVMATVKGDVHDIGKNIVAVVTQCNGFDVKDLGVMVEPEVIVEEARKCNADVIGLSGLITPSLTEMINVVKLLESKGMSTPVIIGGATTSALHTAVKIAPEYPHGIVICAHAAADNPGIIRRLLAEDGKEYIAELKAQQKIIRDNYNRREADKSLLTIEESRKRRFVKTQELVAVPRSTEQVVLYSQPKENGTENFMNIKISDLKERINWAFFYQAWGLKGDVRTGEEGQKLRSDAEALLQEMEEKNLITLQGTARILPAYSTDNDEIIITRDGKDYTLPFPRSLKDEEQTNCLSDHIMRGYRARKLTNCPCCQGQHATDFICPFIVTAGVGLNALQESYRKDGDEYHAIMAKLLCDRLAEAFAEHIQDIMQKRLFWGTDGIRMAFGYGACPDHALKVPVLDMLKADQLIDVSLTESNMINPGESICGLIFANTPLKYFNV